MQIQWHHFDSIDSTNTWSKQHLEEFDPHMLTLVTADEQTEGRGRFNRHWHSPAGQNLYATFNFFVDVDCVYIGNIPQILALSTIEVLKNLSITAQLKWPNDIQVNGKKIGGILCETTLWQDQLAVMLGIGINVNMSIEELNLINQLATSLLQETGKTYSTQLFLSHLVDHFQPNLKLLLEQGFSPFLEGYCHHLNAIQGDMIKFSSQNKVWKGSFDSIESDGSLVLQLEEGTKKQFYTGEVLVFKKIFL